MSAMFTGVVESIARHLGLPAEDGWSSPVELQVDDVAVRLVHHDDADQSEIWMYADLVEIPEEQALNFYREMMEANLLWSGTNGGTIGLNSESHEAVIADRVPLEGLDGDRLARRLARFIDTVEAWREYLSRLSESEQADDALTEFTPGLIRA